MSDTLNLANSIWPNGMKVDSSGYAVFYPLGTNKVNVPTSSSEWPKGNKLVSPYVYQDDKLVGFVDTKALIVSDNTTIYLPYEHIEAQFSAIDKGQLQIHAPNATTKKASWKDSGVEDIPEVQFKYKGCTTVSEIQLVDSYYLTADIVNGVWTEPLWDLTDGTYMFKSCYNLATFSSDLPNLTNGSEMFNYCSRLKSFSSDLSSLENGYSMFANCASLATFSSDLPNLTNGNGMFYCCNNLETFTSNLSSLTNGESMFNYCRNLKSFNANLSSLTNGSYMFWYCPYLESFTFDLSSLTNGRRMFDCCNNLKSFTSDLPSLTDGYRMFYNNALASFSSDLPSLTVGSYMFTWCSNLESFDSDLSSLTDGYQMFGYCKNLTSFSSNLASLTNGEEMFYNCKLDTKSIQNIAETINTYNGTIEIGIGKDSISAEDETYLQQIRDKGWYVYATCNGYPNSGYYTYAASASLASSLTTLDETGESEMFAPKPYWAKPIQSDEEHAKYIDENGNFYNTLGGHYIYVDDPETYGMFTSLEDAVVQMRLTPYVKPQTEIENQ